MQTAPDLIQWLDEISGEEWTWFAKRLSANDTGLTESHQRGIYLQKSVGFPLLGIPWPSPTVRWTDKKNPDRMWDYWLVSHDQHGDVRLIYYNWGGRNECRITRFGGRDSPLQNPENTSRILIMAFRDDGKLQAWVARDDDEEDIIQGRVGPIVPGIALHRRLVNGQLRLDELLPPSKDTCDIAIADLPLGWALEFPAPIQLTAEAVRRVGGEKLDPDTRLMRRYECEFRLFRVVEEAHVLPMVSAGFPQVDDFLNVAMNVLNRRKSRAGRALELHLAAVFAEEGVICQAQAMTEVGSVVDFLFPSLARYQDAEPGDPSVRMLAVKTTLKDRWRQVLAEGRKVRPKHLFTLDEGVSLPQYQQVKAEGIELVVPQRNVAHFPEEIRLDLLTLGKFLDLVKPPVAA